MCRLRSCVRGCRRVRHDFVDDFDFVAGAVAGAVADNTNNGARPCAGAVDNAVDSAVDNADDNADDNAVPPNRERHRRPRWGLPPLPLLYGGLRGDCIM